MSEDITIRFFAEQIENVLVPTISAYELWEILDSKSDLPKPEYDTWITAKLKECHAKEGQDFLSLPSLRLNKQGTLPTVGLDYHLTMDLARCFVIMEQTAFGSQFKDYLVMAERDWHRKRLLETESKESVKTFNESLLSLLRAITICMEKMSNQLDRLESNIARSTEKGATSDNEDNKMSVKSYAKKSGQNPTLHQLQALDLECLRWCKQNSIPKEEKVDEVYGTSYFFPIACLQEVFDKYRHSYRS
jgi:phage anti-repressor protein